MLQRRRKQSARLRLLTPNWQTTYHVSLNLHRTAIMRLQSNLLVTLPVH
ncbi:hypothetical protein Rmar_0784 [Rhodothermus marinus DSM 4252]|uniref:Uncharacterized protein n=1 Tax=Rhodothermus marinus (strain ATCC 43812 / DSM 4252 / R-10) TaxID=518766 RepID=D0MGC6_RHOM4|nr:hypothetical protein Rmar_0784 [Rhodothermus marinus DSM 4252]